MRFSSSRSGSGSAGNGSGSGRCSSTGGGVTTALSATVGVGNIAGVAVAITQGGPGAVFWMWVTAVVGMATKFMTCTLSLLYRKNDENGIPQGGPMYYIEAGLGKKWRWLAFMFAGCGLIGCLPMFQVNQLAEILDKGHGITPLHTGVVTAVIVGIVVLGGIKRIGQVTARLVPAMCAFYLLGCLYVIMTKFSMIPEIFLRIVSDAFTGTAAIGGAEGIAVSVVATTGVKRAVFSNEAGVGTAAMAHGAAKTKEPVREGLVAMVGPFIDTIIVCSMTAFVILSSGNWQTKGVSGISLTSEAFTQAMGPAGQWLVTIAIILFSISTMFGYAYYGRKCANYLVGKKWGRLYDPFYIGALVLGAVWSIDTIINMLDTAFALMAFPNMLATLLLSPKVMKATRDYFKRYKVLRAQ